MARIENTENIQKSAKAELEKMCADARCGERELVFVLNGGRKNLSLKPTASIVRDSFVFNLRYSHRFNTPFEEDQGEADKKTRTPGDYVDFHDGVLRVSKSQRALAMYLTLHPQNGEYGFFRVYNPEASEKNNLKMMDLSSDAFEKIKTEGEDSLRACYYVVTGSDPLQMTIQTMMSDLYNYAKKDPQAVIRAFDDKKTNIKFRLFRAIRDGHVVINNTNTELTWKGGVPIINVSPGENIYEAFASHCLSDNGQETMIILDKKLSR